MKNIFRTLFFITLLVYSKTFSQEFWQKSEFPSYYSGEILSIYTRNNIVLASSYQNGLGLSADYGENWISTSPTTNFQPYSAVAIDNSGFLYALGFDGYLYRSTETGTTWTQNLTVQCFNQKDILVSNNGYIFLGCDQGVYRSTNSGNNWSLHIVGTSSQPIHKINISSTGILVASTASGLYKSTNYAVTWVRISLTAATNLAVNSNGYIFADKYRADPYLYIDTLYRTTDNGASWQPLRQWKGSFIYINPSDDAIALADYDYTSNYFLSTNHGISWTTISTDKSPVAMSYNGDGNYFMGTDGTGIYKSNSISGTWQPRNSGFPGSKTKVSSLVCNSGLIFAATNSFGLFSSHDNGISFTKIYPGLNYINKLSATSNSYMFAIDGSIPRSTDLGISWSYYPPPGVLYDLTTHSLCTNVSTVLTGGNRNTADAELDRSTDNGETWNEVFSITGSFNYDEYKVIALAMNTSGVALGCIEKRHNINPPMPSWIYSYAIIRSSNNGVNWNTSDFTYDKIVDFDWNYSNEVFAITSQGVLKSTDQGVSWDYTAGILPTLNLNSIVISYDGDIYIGTGNCGVIISTDNGNFWNLLNQGIADTVVNSLMISPTGFLFAGTENGGVFRSTNPITHVENTVFNIKSFYLSQNYPNPFNPTTKIKYTIPSIETRHASSLQIVSLKVYDVLGNEVATLVNEEKPAGEYTIEFDAEGLTSGVYFYQLLVSALQSKDGKASSFIQTKKMVLIR